MSGTSPRYPIYVISKGRTDRALTVATLRRHDVPFRLVVEPPEAEAYASSYGEEVVERLPFHDLGLGSIPARNWVWEHAKESGAERHWILDDNIRSFRRYHAGKRVRCDGGVALRVAEDFVDRYENVGIAGLNYHFMLREPGTLPPFYLNVHVYSCMLVRNDLPCRWRGRYNEDTDLCLQVLASGLCTVLLNAFSIEKMATMTMKGGNTDELYADDGRLRMARSLQRDWPHVVSTSRRFGRPQHRIKNAWKGFDTPLKLREDVDLSALPATDEYGLELKAVRDDAGEDVKAYRRKVTRRAR